MKRQHSLCLLTVAGLSAASCMRVDHRPDFRQASQTLEHATGLSTNWAEDPPVRDLELDESRVLPLEQALQLGLSNNRSLRADLQTVAQARAELVQAGLLSNPMLSFMLGLPEGGGLAKLGFGLSKDFADLWLIPSRKRAAQAMLQQRVLSFTDTAIGMVKEIRTTYTTLQYSTAAIALQEENLNILEESMQIAQARLRAGDTSQLDVNLVRARQVQAEIELLNLHNGSRVTQRTLLRLMGVARAPDDWQTDPLPFDEPVPAIPADEAALVEIALVQRLDVQAASWELEAAVAEVEQQQRSVIPSLNAGISGERFERRATPGRDVLADTARASIGAGTLTAPEIESRAQRRRQRAQEIELVLGPSFDIPLPLFDQNQARIAKALSRAKELRERYEEVEQRVIEGVRTAITQLRLAEEKVRLYRESLLPLQQANLSLAESSYRSGRESILTVLLAQEELIRTRLDSAAAIRDLALSLADLERQIAGRVASLLDVATEQPTAIPTP